MKMKMKMKMKCDWRSGRKRGSVWKSERVPLSQLGGHQMCGKALVMQFLSASRGKWGWHERRTRKRKRKRKKERSAAEK